MLQEEISLAIYGRSCPCFQDIENAVAYVYKRAMQDKSVNSSLANNAEARKLASMPPPPLTPCTLKRYQLDPNGRVQNPSAQLLYTST